MKKKRKISVIISFLIISIAIGIKLNLINFNFIFKLFPIEPRYGYLDERWDYEKVIMPNKFGYYMWEIGLKDGGITADRVASGTTVTIVGKRELKMDFKSMEDYERHGGRILFRDFVEKYSKENK